MRILCLRCLAYEETRGMAIRITKSFEAVPNHDTAT
jgi:hypothetical protein